MIVFIITKKICNYFYKGTLSSLIVQSIICFILINGVYIIIFRNREEYNYLKEIFKNIINNIFKNNNILLND